MTRILLVRHGQSEWNALGRWQGQADAPLSDHGRHQAAIASTRIGAVDLMASSTLQRAQATAQIIADQIGVGPVHVDERLIERDAGEWSGLTRSEINEAWPGYLDATPGPSVIERRPPGWEPDDALLERARRALVSIAQMLDGGGAALVVTHGGIIYALEAAHGAERQYLPNLGSRWIDVDARTMTLGDRVHLYDSETDDPQPEQILDADAV